MVKIFGSGSYGKLRAWVTSTLAAHTVIPNAHHSKYTDAEVDTIVAAHTAIVDAHHVKYTDGEVDAIVATHTAITSAHHSKYTDTEVDTIVAAHTAIASAHHAKYLDTEAVSAMGAKGDANALHHDKYTDSEVDAILSVHTAIASAHHVKPTGDGFRAERTVELSVATGTWTDIIFNSEAIDTNNDYDTATGKYTPTIAGYYMIAGNACLDNLNDGKKFIMGVFKNTTLIALDRGTSAVTAHCGGCPTTVIYLDGITDYVKFSVYHNQGSNVNLSMSTGYNTFAGWLMLPV